ncbi:fatty acid--CoA ligase [Thermoflavimicrobium daqui]|jgi:fatty-acyl-CoA synthase|uniref:Long-chain fatty acid--CoA ligase n=1 Tax=Thermoflavimicrobium daqui TaxID=2137476 RepID=A0A364K0S2_9BACL|nr:fatty acid--CoA ligase [Thermoflavimicrobium daqui]RAL21101.1 long-chain fatty acid--CoA ligase [Thermoflavimicrobium daqui]
MYPTLGCILEQTVQRYPDREALVDVMKKRRWTYSEWNQEVNQLANALNHAGVKKGDVVSTCLYNRSELVTILFACAKIGAIFNPINFRLKSEEIAYIIQDAKPRVFIFEQAVEEEILPVFYQFPMTLFWSVDFTHCNWAQSYHELLSQAPSFSPHVDVKEDDIYAVMYTSGTTGRPKGVMHRHRDMIEQSYILAHALQLSAEDRGLCAGPLYHCAELHCMFVPRVHLGATNVLIHHFDPRLVLQTIQDEKISVMFGAPTMWNMMLQEDLSLYHLSTLRIGLYGAAPMPAILIHECKEKLGLKLVQAYGMTEMGPAVTLLYDHEQLTRIGSAGKACLNHEVRIVRPKGDPTDVLKPGEIGEIIVKGPCLMAGYYNKHIATEKAIRNGWYYSGDLGYLDEEGYLYIADRADDMIISGGENIYPREVEEVLCEHPAVLDVAVVGKKDKHWGQKVIAYVVKKDTYLTDKELDRFCCESHKLSSYKRPREYIFVDQLPRNASGKVQKFVLKTS